MVKHLISAIIALFAITSATNVSAQTAEQEFGKHEIKVGWGIGALHYDKNDCGEYAKTHISDSDDLMIYFQGSTGYTYNINDHFGVGADLLFGYGEANIQKYVLCTVGHTYEYKGSALAATRYYWLNKAHFGLYSKLGLGVEYNAYGVKLEDENDDKETTAKKDLEGEEGFSFAYNVIPIAVDFGGKKVRGFAEPQIGPHNFTINFGAKFTF